MTRLAYRCMLFPYPGYAIAQAIRVPHPYLSRAQLGRDRISPQYLMDLAYLFQCDTEDLVGWCEESPDLSAELPCIESGIDTDVPPLPLGIMRQVRRRGGIKPRPYQDRGG